MTVLSAAHASPTKRVTGITFSEDPGSFAFTVKGTRSLAQTAIKHDFPGALLLKFPDTSPDIGAEVCYPPENKFIGSIKVDEIVRGKTTFARIFVVLKNEAPYELTADESGLRVSFHKLPAHSQTIGPLGEPGEKKAMERPIRENIPAAATQLRSVTAASGQNNAVVRVGADGAVENFKSFTLENPARIIFDVYNIESPYKKEIKIAVDSKYLTRVRHFAYPDKIRLVLDTRQYYLSKYSARSENDVV